MKKWPLISRLNAKDGASGSLNHRGERLLLIIDLFDKTRFECTNISLDNFLPNLRSPIHKMSLHTIVRLVNITPIQVKSQNRLTFYLQNFSFF